MGDMNEWKETNETRTWIQSKHPRNFGLKFMELTLLTTEQTHRNSILTNYIFKWKRIFFIIKNC